MDNGGDVKVIFDQLFQGIGEVVKKVGGIFKVKGESFVKEKIFLGYI